MQNKQHNSLIGMLLAMIIVVGWNVPRSMAMNAQQDAAMQRVTESLKRQESTCRNPIRDAIVNNSQLQEALKEYNTMVDQLSGPVLRVLINFIQEESCAPLETREDFETAKDQLKTVLVCTAGDVKTFTDWLDKFNQKMRTLATELTTQDFLGNIAQKSNKQRKQALNQRVQEIYNNAMLSDSAKEDQENMLTKVVEKFAKTSKVNSTPSQEAINYQILSQWFITASAVLKVYAPIMIEHMLVAQRK